MPRKLATALLALSVLAHWPSPSGHADFTYDDKDFVENNASIRSFTTAAQALLLPFPPEQPVRGLYRPLTNLSYSVDYALFGESAYGYHAVNTLLYAVVVLLFHSIARFWFCRRGEADSAGEGLAFAAALIFSVHPVHCAAVDSISGRSELLALGFSLAALRVFLAAASRGVPSRLTTFGAAGLYALGCASKETAVLLPAVALLHLFALEGLAGRDGSVGGWRGFAARSRSLAMPMFAITLLYLGLRLQVLGAFGPGDTVLAGKSLVTRAATAGAVYLEYARLLVFPDVLALDFYYQAEVGVVDRLGARSIAGLALAAAAVVAVATAARAICTGAPPGLNTPAGTIVAGLGSALVFFLPVSHVFGIGALMAERFLFAPSFGITLAAVALLSQLAARSRLSDQKKWALALALVAVVALPALARSQLRAREWRDGVELWRSTDRLIPNDSRVYSNIAVHWIARGQLDEAERALRRALQLDPSESAARVNLAAVLVEQGDLDEAVQIYNEVLMEAPGDFVAWYSLGFVETLRFNDSEALAYFERSLALNPNHEPARARLSTTHERIALSRRLLHETRTLARDTKDPKMLERLERACRIIGDVECAERYAERAQRVTD